MSSQPLENKLSLYFFGIMIGLIVLIMIVQQIVSWLSKNFGPIWAQNWGWFLAVGLIILAGGATPLLWKIYITIHSHVETKKDRAAQRALVEGAALAMAQGYNVKFSNPAMNAILEVSNTGHKQLQMPVQPQLALEVPKEPEETAIADVVRYDEVVDEVPAGMSLLGIHPADGSLELTQWEKLKCVWLAGSSSTGKSNTIFGKAREAVGMGAKLIVVDQHANKPDSLARKLAPLSYAFLQDIAVSDEQVLAALEWFNVEFERRVNGASCDQKIVLICDEMNRMVRNEKLKAALKEIVLICGEESRGFGMYGWFLSQKCAGLKWLRDSAITVIVHRLTRFEEALLACNDDRAAAKKLLSFKIGRTYIYGVDFDEPMELQQPLYEVPADRVVEASTSFYNAPTSTLPDMSHSSLPPLSSKLNNGRDWEATQEADGSDDLENELPANLSTIKELREIGKRLKKGESPADIVKSYGLPYGRATQELRTVVDMIATQMEQEA